MSSEPRIIRSAKISDLPLRYRAAMIWRRYKRQIYDFDVVFPDIRVLRWWLLGSTCPTAIAPVRAIRRLRHEQRR